MLAQPADVVMVGATGKPKESGLEARRGSGVVLLAAGVATRREAMGPLLQRRDHH